VELLEDDSASGYSRVKVAPGREGWVLTRYLSTEPAARERLVGVQAELAEQQAQVRKLEGELARLRETATISGGAVRPAIDPPAEPVKPRTDPVLLGTGAGLFIAGLLTGMLVTMMRRPRARRRAGRTS
jgi:hypothetical protein